MLLAWHVASRSKETETRMSAMHDRVRGDIGCEVVSSACKRRAGNRQNDVACMEKILILHSR